MHSAEPSAADRRVPLEAVHVDGRRAERRLALRLGVGAAAELRGVGLDDQRQIEMARLPTPLLVDVDNLFRLRIVGAKRALDAVAQCRGVRRRRVVGVDVPRHFGFGGADEERDVGRQQ